MQSTLCSRCGEGYVSVAVWMAAEDAEALLRGEKRVPDVQEYVHWNAADEERVAKRPEEVLCYCDNCGVTEILSEILPLAS